MNQPVHGLVEGLFRRSAGRIVAMLTARLGAARLDLAEEAVQESLLKALLTWPHRGVPLNPEGWLMRAAHNRALDLLRADARHDEADRLLALELSPDSAGEQFEELQLLLLCCQPSLTPRSRVALALKTVGGFSVGEIARAFLSEPEAVAQLLVRAKRTLRDEGLRLDVMGADALNERLPAALDTLYLMFNEGYSATDGERAIRDELCIAAIRLTEMFLAHEVTARPEVEALLALMYLQASRLVARRGPDGELRLLDDQDRGEWDRTMIATGFHHLERAATGDRISAWHVEAAIASVHAAAATPQQTNWRRIVALYDDLIVLKSSPVVRLNRAVALGRIGQVDAGLAELDRIATHPAMRRYFLLDAARAELLLSAGQPEAARAALIRALSQVGTEPERRLLRDRIDLLTKEHTMTSPRRFTPLAVMLALVTLLASGFASHGDAGRADGGAAADSLFAIAFTVGPAWDSARPFNEQFGAREHSQNLARLRREGKILVGGRFGAVGLMVVRASDSGAVRAELASDSATARGVFNAEISVWRTVYEGTVPAR